MARREVAYDGLAASLLDKCSPCHYHYDAVIYMETFEKDSRWRNINCLQILLSNISSKLLNNVGLGWASPTHRNNHGSHEMK